MADFFGDIRRLQTKDWQVAVDMYVEEAIRLIESTIGYFAILSWSEDELTMLGWSKTAMDACRAITKPIKYRVVETGLWGDCVRVRMAVITNDYATSSNPNKRGYPSGHVPVVRHMNVPINQGQKIRGILGVGNKSLAYTDGDAGRLQKFADEGWMSMGKLLAL